MTNDRKPGDPRPFLEMRSYNTGWVARIGSLCLTRNKQSRYSEITLSWLSQRYKHVGGNVVLSLGG